MSDRDELAYQVFRADNRLQSVDDCRQDWAALDAAQHGQTYAHHIADGLIDAGYRKPEQITTIEQLRALPDKTIGITADGYAFKVEYGLMFWPGTDDYAKLSDPDYEAEVREFLPATIVYKPGA